MQIKRSVEMKFKVTQREKEKIINIGKLLGHKSTSELLLTSLVEYVNEHTNLDISDLKEERRTNYGR